VPASQRTVAIIGLGLMGGSLAAALRGSGFARRFIGFGHREASLRRGVELGIIDDFSLDLAQVVEQSDIVVICTPTLVASQMLEQILPLIEGCADAPVITDVASVKGSIHATALRVAGEMPPGLVLGHPIAGSERSGVEAADAQLFLNHRVILTPVDGNDPQAVELVRAMWLATGAEVVDMDVDEHDAVLAATSHLPHVLAYALVDALAQSEASADIFRFAAGGFRDFTRIASSDPVMWRDIAIANKTALLRSVDDFAQHLQGLRTAIEAQDGDALHAIFTRAKAARDTFAEQLAERNKQGDQPI
tara:strand:- start:28406 stop:29320 length:915 start_codon:yes stop_codon:yes gene_type:complete